MHLFVYGTLMSSARHPMGRRLAREARLLGRATIRGWLFDLGRYPGLVESGEKDGLVHGEAYLLGSAEASLRWLDAYEGFMPGHPQSSDYERVLRSVELETGECLTAWVYLYRRDVGHARLIESGRWEKR